MLASRIRGPRQRYTEESNRSVPEVVLRLLAGGPGTPVGAEAWEPFVAEYSDLLLRVATGLGTDYDAVLDRYAYMLDELRRDDCRRLRRFVADGRSTFSTWLAVVARRLCLDHYRRRYGRLRGAAEAPAGALGLAARRQWRRRLSDLAGALTDVASVEDPSAADSDELLDARQRRDRLAQAVTVLPADDRLLLQLRFEQEMTGREIATLLGLPTPFHVYRRLEALYAALQASLGTPDATARVTRSPQKQLRRPVSGKVSRRFHYRGES